MGKFDSRGDEGWEAYGRETRFHRLVAGVRSGQVKYKAQKQRTILDRSRAEVLSDERQEELERVALSDRTTGLPNLKAFNKRLEYELRRAKRYKRPLSLLYLAVDDMKNISRQYGALTVDDIMRASANIVRQSIRDVDFAGRLNQHVIGVIFPETYSSRALVVAERIRANIKNTNISPDLKGLRVTCSLGIAAFPSNGRGAQDLSARSLEFLELAQGEGGDCIRNGA